MSRVALATSSALPRLDADSATLLPVLAALGVEAVPEVWDDADVDWSSYDLVVVRSCWDYTLRHAEFLAWAEQVPQLANPFPVLAWNTDKTYLRALAAAGVPVVPTAFVAPDQVWSAPEGEFVVKPTVSAGARDTGRFSGAAAAGDLVARLHAQGRTAMVQPYVDAVDEHGETSVLAFGGEVSHGARKAPLLLPGTAVRLDDTDTDTDTDNDTDLDGDDVVQPREPTPAELAVARAALDAIPWHEPLVYARVDLVPGPGGPLVLELEVTEPSLFLRLSEGAAARCATAVQAALAR